MFLQLWNESCDGLELSEAVSSLSGWGSHQQQTVTENYFRMLASFPFSRVGNLELQPWCNGHDSQRQNYDGIGMNFRGRCIVGCLPLVCNCQHDREKDSWFFFVKLAPSVTDFMSSHCRPNPQQWCKEGLSRLLHQPIRFNHLLLKGRIIVSPIGGYRIKIIQQNCLSTKSL